MDGTDSQIVDVLLVEDDPGDALLAREALIDSHGTAVRCHVASDGQVATRFLWRQAEFAKAPRPRLILLDLNLGASHGLEILARVKDDEKLRTIPVVVLSSSRHPADIHDSYAHHASAYIVKPLSLDDFSYTMNVIDACFLRLAEPALPCEGTDFREHPVLGIEPASEPG
jgi:CheY-like chemotaxis protein